mmetsp:Transcript_15266/g.31391  ORF Transcript_15266/g.31391 Transcript_15266/m.31391 type:complete len:292 (-) Transcript_15266:308-1183(-)
MSNFLGSSMEQSWDPSFLDCLIPPDDTVIPFDGGAFAPYQSNSKVTPSRPRNSLEIQGTEGSVSEWGEDFPVFEAPAAPKRSQTSVLPSSAPPPTLAPAGRRGGGRPAKKRAATPKLRQCRDTSTPVPVNTRVRSPAVPSPSASTAASLGPAAKVGATGNAGPGRPACPHKTMSDVSVTSTTSTTTARCTDACGSKLKQCNDCGTWQNYNNFWRHRLVCASKKMPVFSISSVMGSPPPPSARRGAGPKKGGKSKTMAAALSTPSTPMPGNSKEDGLESSSAHRQKRQKSGR